MFKLMVFVRRSRTLTSHLACLVLCVFVSIGQAAQVTELYSVSLPVLSQSDSDRKRGFEKALEKVLIKVSGDKVVLANSGIDGAFKSAPSLVQTYSYSENPAFVLSQDSNRTDNVAEGSDKPEVNLGVDAQEGALTADKSDTENSVKVELVEEPYLLEVSFAQRSVDELLTRYSVPIWGDIRPSIMFWVATESEGQRSLLGATDELLPSSLEKLSNELGLPVFLPTVDLEDQVLVDLNDLWGLFPSAIEKASVRYGADLNVLVKLTVENLVPDQSSTTGQFLNNETSMSSNHMYRAEWLLVMKGDSSPMLAESDSLEGLLGTLLSDISSRLAQRFAVLEGAEYIQQGLQIEVSNIKGFRDYAQLGNYLSGLPVLDGLNMLWAQGDRISFTVDLKGGKERFLEFLEIGGKLKYSPPNATLDRAPSYLDPSVLGLAAPERADENLDVFDLYSSYSQALEESEKFVWLGN